MKKLILGLAVTSLVSLAGCSDSPKEPIIPDGTAGSGGGGGTALTKLVFAPGDGNIPVPNDLLFGGTDNLTLNIPIEEPASPSDPLVAINGLDGWSSIAPMGISFSNTDEGIDIAPSSVVPGSTVRMFKVNVSRPEVSPGVIGPTGPVTGVAEELVAGVDFVATYAGPMSVAILPLRPLEQQSSYMVIVTNGITDTRGNAIIPDAQYTIAKSETPISQEDQDPDTEGDQLLPTAALEPVRQLVNAMENAAQAAGIDKQDVVLSVQYTVQSMGTTLEAAKGLYVDFPFSNGVLPATSFTPLNIPTSGINPALSGDALVSVGTINLNYMLEAPDAANSISTTVVSSGYWKTAMMVPDGLGGMMENPRPLDDLTYANPLPQVNSVETVPLMVSLPSNDMCPKPYPVMIFQHGITSNRTAMLGIADTMAKICTAVISMDQPLHGLDETGAPFFVDYNGGNAGGLRERTFGVDLVDNSSGAPGPDDNIDASGTHTINLVNLRASRDNLRQAIFDLLTLEKAIPAMDVDLDMVPDFDPTKVYFMGHSLGGIVGSTFVAKSDLVKVAVLANPGGGIAGLLDASDTFGPRIRAGLASVGVEAGSPEYQLFLIAAQTTIDSGDPANYAMEAVSREMPIPTLMFRVVGDTVVPNNSPTAPLSGTDPLGALLALPVLAASNPGEVVAGSRFVTRLNGGTHSTVLTPAGPESPIQYLDYTTEMQTQIATFIGSSGQSVTVTNPDLLD